jgi:chromosomal replication initiator protein
MNHHATWEDCKQYLRQHIPAPLFDTFIRPISSVKSQADQLHLHSPANSAARQHIENRYLPLIQDYLAQRQYQGQVSLISKRPLLENKEIKVDLSQINTNQDSIFYAAEQNQAQVTQLQASLPKQAYLIQGGAGSGKTHLGRLLVSIHKQQGFKTCYLSLEQYLSQFALACRKKNTIDWRDNLRQNQLLVIDDLQYLKTSASKTIEELQNLIDDFQISNKGLILLSTSEFNAQKYSEGLRSRLLSQTLINLDYPNLSQRIQILNNSLAEHQIHLDLSITTHLARHIKRDIRLLKSVAERLSILGSAQQIAKWDLSRLEPLLSELYTKSDQIDPQHVLEIVAEFYRLPKEIIVGQSRQKGPSIARHLFAWICTEELGMSQKETAKLIGRSDHGSVVHARKRITQSMQNDLFFARQVSQIIQRLHLND